MKLILAQGNPGSDYARTRHNVGFAVLDELARAHDTTLQPRDKFKSLIAEIVLDDEKIILAQPATFYNETGQAARAIVDFYKLDPASDVLVIHDELALPFGTLRVRDKGSDAGNNGIKSLNTHLGSDYHRLRIGIWSDRRDVMADSDFVLSRFTPEETEQLSDIFAKSATIIDQFVRGELAPTTL